MPEAAEAMDQVMDDDVLGHVTDDSDNTPTGDAEGAGGGGDEPAAGTPPAWKGQLSKDLKDNAWFDQFKTISDLGKHAFDLHGKLDKALFLPGEDATDEDRATYLKAIGCPETPDGYEITLPKFPEGMPPVYGEEQLGAWKKTFHEAGLTKDQADKLARVRLQEAIAAYETVTEKRLQFHNANVKALQDKHGDEYQPLMEKASSFASKHGGDDLVTLLDRTGMGDHPVMIDFILKMIRITGEDKDLSGGPGGGGERSAAETLYPEMKG